LRHHLAIAPDCTMTNFWTQLAKFLIQFVLRLLSLPSSIASDEEIITRTMVDVIKDYNTDELIEYLRKKNLKHKESYFEIF
jgi:hypothetical protein